MVNARRRTARSSAAWRASQAGQRSSKAGLVLGWKGVGPHKRKALVSGSGRNGRRAQKSRAVSIHDSFAVSWHSLSHQRYSQRRHEQSRRASSNHSNRCPTRRLRNLRGPVPVLTRRSREATDGYRFVLLNSSLRRRYRTRNGERICYSSVQDRAAGLRF
jgi:hypothetical protein